MCGVGKGGVAVSCPMGVICSSLKKSSIFCLNVSLLNFIFSSTLNFPENGGKTFGPAGCSVCDAEFSVPVSCKSSHSEADIMSSQLCAL